MDMKKLLDEVEEEVKNLLKSAQTDASNLKKAEESKKEGSSKEASSKEMSSKEESSMKKADIPQASAEASKEGSGYESQAPEASDAATPSEQPDPAVMQDQGGDASSQESDVAGMLQGLDDDMLHELYQKIKMELMGRMQGADQGGQPDQADPGAAPAMDAAQPPAPPMHMAMSEKTQFTEKLAKAESEVKSKDAEIEALKKAVAEREQGIGEFADIVKNLIERPVIRAVNDIQFVPKDGELKKSEVAPEDMKKAVDAISNDRKKLASLTKSEIDTIADFYSGKNVSEKIMKVINK